MSLAPGRLLAWRVLVAVDEGAPLDPRLEEALARTPEPRDRALLAEMVKGTLRWRGRYDHLLGVLSRRGAPAEPGLLNLLRLSLHQLVALGGVPDHAVLHQAGELCRQEVSPRLVGYVNGVLRETVRRLGAAASPAEALLPLFPDPAADPLGHLATWESHPRWLVERWAERWGEAEAAALCRHDNQPPPLTLHVLPPAQAERSFADLAAAGFTVERGRHHERALVLGDRFGRERLEKLLSARRELIVQDEGAQLLTSYLGAGLPPGRLLDACAAPGGKTVALAAARPAPAAGIVAMDLSLPRLAVVLRNLERTGLRLPVVLGDAGRPPLRPGSCAAVLLDGPCSGTGVLRHHPEARWRLRALDLRRGGERLLTLARGAVTLLAPGGLLLYGTCSLEPEENDEVVAALLADGELEPAPPPGGSAAEARRQWLPQRTGTDGFYGARLRRKETA